MTGSDVEQVKPGEVAELSQEEQALVQSVKGRIDRSELILPAIKLTHSLTQEVQDGDAQPGVYINSLTKTEYGTDVPFVVCGIYKGRFYSDEEGGVFVARGDVAPDNWPEEYAGKPFADIPDAEEQWKLNANAGKHPWASGPPIATTHNFVGFVPGDESDLPLRLSLMRASQPAASKLKTMVISLRAPWDRVFRLRVRRGINKQQQTYFATEVATGDPITPEERQRAVAIAAEFQRAEASGDIQEQGDDDPEAAGKKGATKSRAKKDGEALSVD
jgi:hypothetical protein